MFYVLGWENDIREI